MFTTPLTGVVDRLVEVRGSSVLHFTDNESTDLRWRIFLSTSLNPSVTVAVGNDLVWDIREILLDFSILEFSTDQTGSQLRLSLRHTV